MRIRPPHRAYVGIITLLTAVALFVFPLQTDYLQAQSAPAPPAGSYVPDEILVKYRPVQSGVACWPGEGRLDEEIDVIPPPVPIEEPEVVLVKLPAGLTVQEALETYRLDPQVEYAEPNYYRRIKLIPNDTSFGLLWGMPKIMAPEAWDINTDCSSVIVAVIDTGADYLHPDLAANINIAEGRNFIDVGSNPLDLDGHGTHVTGTVAAVGNNARGVAGVCWDARIMVLKAFDDFGVGRVSDIVDAMNYARLNGARIVNASFTGATASLAEQDAVELLNTSGILLVTAAGNENQDNDRVPSYPASYGFDNIIAVAASRPDDSKAGYSNFGRNSVDVAAPGSSILSTFPLSLNPDGYLLKFGTSMATAHVSGLAALVWAHEPALTLGQARARILDGVDRLAGLSGRVFTGGRINAFNSIRGVPATPSGLAGVTSPTRIDLSWDDNYFEIEGFVLERSDGGTGPFVEIARLGPDVFSYLDIDVVASATYVYRLRAIKNGSESESAELTAAAVATSSSSGGGGGGGGGFCFIASAGR
ncbi:MAG: S8 family serine peptidase [Desulfobacterales bacterium]